MKKHRVHCELLLVCQLCLWTLISSCFCDMFALFPPSFCSARAEGKCYCKHFCRLRGRSFAHLSPPRIPQSQVTASSTYASTSTPLNPFFPPRLYDIPPFPSHCISMHSHTYTNAPPPPPPCTHMHTSCVSPGKL